MAIEVSENAEAKLLKKRVQKHLVALGCRQYVEAGPGKQLKAMMRRIDQECWGKMTVLDD